MTSGDAEMLRTLHADCAETLLEPSELDAEVIARVLRALIARVEPDAIAHAAMSVAQVAASTVSRSHVGSVAELVAWLLTIEPRGRLARLVLTLDLPNDAQGLTPALLLHVTRAAARLVGTAGLPSALADANVVALERHLYDYLQERRRCTVGGYLFSRGQTDLGSLSAARFRDDLLATSARLQHDAASGTIVYAERVKLSAGGRRKKLDLAIGEGRSPPIKTRKPASMVRGTLQRAVITVDVKACMTSHRQSSSRMLDEIRASLDVTKGHNPTAIPVMIAVINVAGEYTSPDNLPGPNKHSQREIGNLVRKVTNLHLDSGSRTERAFGAVAIVLVDTDNQTRMALPANDGLVPEAYTYRRAVARAAALYDRGGCDP